MVDTDGAHHVLMDALQFVKDFKKCVFLSGDQLDWAGWKEWCQQAVEDHGAREAHRFLKGVEVPKAHPRPPGRAMEAEIKQLLHFISIRA
eukprot:2627535-Pyramimonas_sp.AAC.1